MSQTKYDKVFHWKEVHEKDPETNEMKKFVKKDQFIHDLMATDKDIDAMRNALKKFGVTDTGPPTLEK